MRMAPFRPVNTLSVTCIAVGIDEQGKQIGLIFLGSKKTWGRPITEILHTRMNRTYR